MSLDRTSISRRSSHDRLIDKKVGSLTDCDVIHILGTK